MLSWLLMKRRSRIDVLIDILTEALNGCSKTKLMYRCNLNYRCFNRYLKELLDKDLLIKIERSSKKTIHYKTTEKGKELLQVLRRAKQLTAS